MEDTKLKEQGKEQEPLNPKKSDLKESSEIKDKKEKKEG